MNESPQASDQEISKWRRRIKRSLIGLIIFCAFCYGLWILLDWGNKGPPTISKETTYLLEPVKADGEIDYWQAYNEKYFDPIDPNENAVVQIVEALGPLDPEEHASNPEWFQRFWQRLNHDPAKPEPTGPFLEGFWKECYQPALYPNVSTEFLMDHIHNRPWTTEMFPDASQWVHENQRAIELTIEASKKKHFVIPVLDTSSFGPGYEGNSDYSFGVAYRLVGNCRASAMLDLGEGRDRDCIEKLIAVRRLAVLMTHSSTEETYRLGLMILALIRDTENSMLISNFKDESLSYFRSELLGQRKLGKVENYFEVDVRWEVLRLAQELHPEPRFFWNDKHWNGEPTTHFGRFDIDTVMREFNAHTNEIERILEEYDGVQRTKKLHDLDDVLDAKVESSKKLTAKLRLGISRQGRSHLCVADYSIFLASNLLRTNHESWMSEVARQRMLFVAIALERHRLKNGSYPKTLSKIDKEFCETGPDWLIDPFSENDFQYKQGSNGYWLYSIGRNLQNDTVLTEDSGDDIGILHLLDNSESEK